VSSDLPISAIADPLTVSGKFFRAGGEDCFLKTVTFGPFPAGAFPDEGIGELPRISGELGANALRLFEVPSIAFLHACAESGLRVFITIPWAQHVDFFADPGVLIEGEETMLETVRGFRGHPAVAGYFVANEIESTLVRWLGPQRVREELERWIELGKANDPDALFSYANYPSTEYLLPVNQDFVSFNIYLEERVAYRRYLERLQNLSGDKPLLVSEFGVDARTHGEEGQSGMLSWFVEESCLGGAAGATIFSWSDRWQRGGETITEWDFGLTDREGNERPALHAVSGEWKDLETACQIFPIEDRPKVSVIVCTHRGSATLAACLRSLQAIDYPDYEVIVVNDGDDTRVAEITAEFEGVRHCGIPHQGLGHARNVGADLAEGEIFAYTDDDCFVPPDWLTWLVIALNETPDTACAGGPNIPPPPENRKLAVIGHGPGAPAHVLLDDREAEHIPGCNLAVRREAFEKIGGFDIVFERAGDDADFCWRLHDAGYRIGFHAAAFVWHERRRTVRGYLRQQSGYGRAEALLMTRHLPRFRHFWGAEWKGTIYAAAPVPGDRIYHGSYGYEPYQFLYSIEQSEVWHLLYHASWWVLAGLSAVVGIVFWPFAALSCVMVVASLVAAWRQSGHAHFDLEYADALSRLQLMGLILMQGVARSSMRLREGWKLTAWGRSFRRMGLELLADWRRDRWKGGRRWKFWSDEGRGRDELLAAILEERPGWQIDPTGACDLVRVGQRMPFLGLLTVTEFHEDGGTLTRVSERFRTNYVKRFTIVVVMILLAAIIGFISSPAITALWAVVAGLAWAVPRTIWHCFRRAGTGTMVASAGRRAGLRLM